MKKTNTCVRTLTRGSGKHGSENHGTRIHGFGWKTGECKSREKKSMESESFNNLLLSVLTENSAVIFGYH